LLFDDVEYEDPQNALVDEMEMEIENHDAVPGSFSISQLKERFDQIIRDRQAQRRTEPPKGEGLSKKQPIETNTLEREPRLQKKDERTEPPKGEGLSQKQPIETNTLEREPRLQKKDERTEPPKEERLSQKQPIQTTVLERERLRKEEQARETRLQQEQQAKAVEAARIQELAQKQKLEQQEQARHAEAARLQQEHAQKQQLQQQARTRQEDTEAVRTKLMILNEAAKDFFGASEHDKMDTDSTRVSEDIEATKKFFAQGASHMVTRSKKGRSMENSTSSPTKFSISSSSERISRSPSEPDSENGCVCGYTHNSKYPTGLVFWMSCQNCDSNYMVAPKCVGFKKDKQPKKWVCRICEDNEARDVAEGQDIAKKRMLAVLTDLEYYFMLTNEGSKPTTFKYKHGMKKDVTSGKKKQSKAAGK
jgi:hypothetical protein